MIKRVIKKLLRKDKNYEMEYRIKSGLKIGKGSVCFSWSGLDGNWPWLISIGDNVTISSNVIILAHDASPNKVGCHTKLGKVSIGNNVFIGAGTIVLCDTKIGDNVIVGAGSLVNRDLESGYVYAGNPARKVETIENYQKKHQQLNDERPYLAEIRRWDDWKDASNHEKEKMKELLQDGCGYI